MNLDHLPDNEYLLLTPGPLSTTKRVKSVMLKDWCTWDNDYNAIVQKIRRRLVDLSANDSENYTSVLMQGSGTFAVEAAIQSCVPADGKLLIPTNGEYGRRIARIAERMRLNARVVDGSDLEPVDPDQLEKILQSDKDITHIAVVHCETTTGLLNPIREIGSIARNYGKIYLVDAMSSFGGMEMGMTDLKIDFLVSSANKCIQGVPGFGFVIARTEKLIQCKGRSRSLSLDLFDQWETMEKHNGKWRFTSPTHVVRAFHEALMELDEEGGVSMRYRRYRENQNTLAAGMKKLGFKTAVPDELQSPIITTFYYPDYKGFDFKEFYNHLKRRGFVIYPGKLTSLNTFRVGSIGDVWPNDMKRLVEMIGEHVSGKMTSEDSQQPCNA